MRIVKCNQLDLNLFQIDWDLTFAVLFINADKTIYARYGTRNSLEANDDVALEGLAATMQNVLEIHQAYPQNKDSLATKQPVAIEQSVPEDFASLDHFKPDLDYKGKVAKSCIHCHQVRDAARMTFREANEPIPSRLLFPFPSPQIVGIQLNTKTRATIQQIAGESPAANAGLMPSDDILSINGHSVSSEADIQWLLHNLGSESQTVSLTLRRDGAERSVMMRLPEDWRALNDLSWRPTSWDMRRMATGGMTLVPLDGDARRALGLAEDQMALRSDHVGIYGHHARAKKAGIRKQDIILSYDNQKDLMTESALLRYALQEKRPGDFVQIEYQRGEKKHTTRLRLQ